ncbi:prolipoprotein diacylglyceryl transferase [Peptoniphilus sp.]|uniref:prolipoprotein diacylglyceryl transferase n=1 Tax=Peptoniphilus sp. TaxID=1971214 RepID=UPI003994D23D
MNPTAFTIFGIDIKWYGILIATGALLGVLMGDKLAKEEGLKENIVSDFILIGIIPSVIGARIYYVIFEWDYYKDHINEIFAIRNGGLAIYGAIITGLIIAYIYSNKKGVEFFKLIDVMSPGLALGQGIGRWGNFINMEAHGGPTDLPWGIMVDGVKVHPTFLYESIVDISLALFLYFYISKHKKFDGQMIAVYGIVYGIGRFFIEGMRTDSLYIGGIRVSQLVSLVFIALGIYIYIIKGKKIDNSKL